MIDYLLKFSDEATAQADATVGPYYVNGQWHPDYCITGMQFWDKNSDVAGTDAQGNPTVTHTFLPGFWLLIALPARDAALDASAGRQLVFDEAKYRSGATLAQSVVYSAYTLPQLSTKRFQPLFAGRSYGF